MSDSPWEISVYITTGFLGGIAIGRGENWQAQMVVAVVAILVELLLWWASEHLILGVK